MNSPGVNELLAAIEQLDPQKLEDAMRLAKNANTRIPRGGVARHLTAADDDVRSAINSLGLARAHLTEAVGELLVHEYENRPRAVAPGDAHA